MEVPGRPALASRRLSVAATEAWARHEALVAAVVAVGIAALIAFAQPVRSPWWIYADADATYTAAALNLVGGHRAQFVDHPGLPVTEAAALVFGADALARGHVSRTARERYADERLLDLDRARPVFRGLAIAFYLAGALLAFVALARLLGHWTWGLAASLLWIAAPGLQPMSIQLRPDVLLAVCCLAFAYLVGRAVETREARSYAVAAAVAGAALTVKLHAVGLLVPLALLVIWKPPLKPWRPRPRVVVATVGAVVAAAVLLNLERLPFTPTAAQAAMLAVAVVAVTIGAALAALRDAAVVAVAYAAGVLVPVALDPPDGLQALVVLARSAAGRGVSDVPAFSTPLASVRDLVGLQALLVFLLAALAVGFGLRRRDARPVLWAVAALAMAVLAWARPVVPHYLAPAFVLALPAALWLLQRTPRTAAPLLVWPVVLWIAWPAIRHRDAPARAAEQLELHGARERRAALQGLRAGEVRLVPSYSPQPDVRYFELVELYVDHSPRYPYRLLPETDAARRFARERGLRIR